MRATQAIDATAGLLRQHLDADVAAAIIGDTEPFEAAARALGHAADGPEALAAIVTAITAGIDDRTADWLTGYADSPGAWFFRQVRDRT